MASLLTGVSATQNFLIGLKPILALVLFVLLAVVSGTAASASIASRRAEVGMLRAFGWLRREVVGTFATQFAFQGAVVGVLGALIALVTLVGIKLMGGTISPFGVPMTVNLDGAVGLQLLGLAGATIVVFAIASAIPAIRASAVAPDDVLRDIKS